MSIIHSLSQCPDHEPRFGRTFVAAKISIPSDHSITAPSNPLHSYPVPNPSLPPCNPTSSPPPPIPRPHETPNAFPKPAAKPRPGPGVKITPTRLAEPLSARGREGRGNVRNRQRKNAVYTVGCAKMEMGMGRRRGMEGEGRWMGDGMREEGWGGMGDGIYNPASSLPRGRRKQDRQMNER